MPMDYSGGPFEVSEALLLEIINWRKSTKDKGVFVSGIPDMNSDRRTRAWSVLNLDTRQRVTVQIGDPPYRFSQQSMSKPTAAFYAMSLLAGGLEEFKRHLGNEFSGQPYNEFNFDAAGRPQNFSDNIGALKVWDLIASKTNHMSDPFQGYLRWFRGIIGGNVEPNVDMARGEYQARGQNLALLRVLGIQETDPRFKRVYLSYCRACSVQVTVEEMATVFSVIANSGVNARNGQQVVPANVANHVMEGMRRHGAYNESEIYWTKAGLWSKTGVHGGIMGKVENHPRWVFCVQHPELNGAGNSGEALKWITDFSRLRLEWPRVPTLGAPLPAHTPTGEALNLRLRQLMTPDSLQKLMTMIAGHAQANNIDGKLGSYLKLNPKGKRLEADEGGIFLMEARDTLGNYKRYYYMPDTHYLHKIVVEHVGPHQHSRGTNPFATR